MKKIRLLAGAHPAPFDAEDNATMCAQEFAAYLAGEPHSDRPKCVSPVLNRFMILWNDDLDDETRQKLRPYISRTIGTAGDGQDEARSYMALDWLIRVYTPAFLDLAGHTDEAASLRNLAAIDDINAVREAEPTVRAAGAAAKVAFWEAARAAARAAAKDAAKDAVWEAAWVAAWIAAWIAAKDATEDATEDAARKALEPTVEALQQSAFELLDRMIDPGGIHDIRDEGALLAACGREPLVFSHD